MLPLTGTTPDFPSLSAHRNKTRLKPRKSTLDGKSSLNEASPTHGMPDVIAHSSTGADHRMFHPSHTYRPRLKRVERAKALMHEVMGRFS